MILCSGKQLEFGVTKMKFDIPVLKFPHLQNGTNINEIT